jgi:hypothetical protein
LIDYSKGDDRMENIMSYNSDLLAQTSSAIGNASSKAAEAQGVVTGRFTGMSTLFGNGIGEIGNQLGSLQGSLTNVQGIMTRQSESMFSMDEALAKAANAIEIPQDFVKNETNRFTEYHDMLLEKVDGESVNKGKEDNVHENLDNSSIAGQEGMYNLTTDGGKEEQVYDETSAIGGQEGVYDLTTAGGSEEQVYDERSGIAKQQEMVNIANNGGQAEQKYNEESAIASAQVMTDISNGGGLSTQELRDNSRINAQEALMNMNTQGGVNVQTLHDVTGSLQDLKDISGAGKAQETMDAVQMQNSPSGVIKQSNDELLNTLKEDIGK